MNKGTSVFTLGWPMWNCHNSVVFDLLKWQFHVVQHNINSKSGWLRLLGGGNVVSIPWHFHPTLKQQSSFPKFWGKVPWAQRCIYWQWGGNTLQQSWKALHETLTARPPCPNRMQAHTVSVAHICNPRAASTRFLRLYHFLELHKPMLLRF